MKLRLALTLTVTLSLTLTLTIALNSVLLTSLVKGLVHTYIDIADRRRYCSVVFLFSV